MAYLPSLRAGFVWDDDTFLTQNPLIKAADGLRRFWATAEATDYWPVTSTTLWVEWRLWGMHAAGYHATNLLLHIGECLLLWRIFALLRIPGAYLAALIFAVHPVNVESVAWIAQRKNLLAMLFFLASIFCFIRVEAASPTPASGGVGGGGRAWYWLSLASFILALLSKGSVATLPLVLLGIVAWRRKIRARDLLHLLPFFLAAAAFAALDVWFQGHGSAEVIRSAGPLERILGAGGVIWFYLFKAIWPLNLIFVYPQWHVVPSDWRWWLPLLSAVAVTIFLLRRALAKSENGAIRSPLLAAWLYFCVMLVPVMGFANVYFMKYSLVADHYQHLALIGVAAYAGAAWTRWKFRGSAAIAAAVACAFACLTWRQCLDYRDAETLYRATIASNPGCWMAHNNLGASYQGDGEWAKAMEQYREALRLRPQDAAVHNNLGAVWLKMPDRLNDAIVELGEALRLKPDFAEAHHNLGIALARVPGGLPEAIAQYEEALRLKPEYAEAHYHLAIALGQFPGRLSEAIAQYEEALRQKPDYVEAHHDLAITLAQTPSRLPEAIGQYEEALRLKPDYAEAHYHLAIALGQIEGRQFEAIAHYEAALRIRPDYAEAHNNLAAALAKIPGRMPEAIAHFEEALRLKPDYAEAHYNLALAYAGTGRSAEAIRHLQMALRLNPNLEDARRNLEQLEAPGGAVPDGK